MTVTLHSGNDELQPQISTGDHCSLADKSNRLEVLLRSQKVRKKSGNHPASNISLEFFVQGVTYLLKNESYKYKTEEDNDLWLLLVPVFFSCLM